MSKIIITYGSIVSSGVLEERGRPKIYIVEKYRINQIEPKIVEMDEKRRKIDQNRAQST